MLAIAPSCDCLKRALIANALSSISSNAKEENIIVDFSVPATEAFWSLYKSGIKYVEDIIGVLPGINLKMLKSFLSPSGTNLVLGLKNKKLSEIPPADIEYLLDMLDKNYKRVFVILPDENSGHSFEIIKKSQCVLMPFVSDAVSVQNAVMLANLYSSETAHDFRPLPLKLKLDYEFHSDKILNSNEIFKNALSAGFTADFERRIFSPQYSYRDKTSEFTLALEKALDYCGLAAQTGGSADDISKKYYAGESVYRNLKNKVYGELIEEMKLFADETDEKRLKELVAEKVGAILKKLDLNLPVALSERIFKELSDDVAGLGAIEDFIKEPGITEIMVNGYNNIYIEKSGRLFKSEAEFSDEKQLRTVIDRIVAQTGRHIDEASPIVDARLKDGSRVNAVIKPIALNGSVLTIRKFLKNKLSVESLISSASISKEMSEFLKIAVLLKKNIIISGGTGTGKTTLLNAVSSFIPENERLITIEDSAELQLRQKHVVRLESRPKSTEGSGEISIKRLVVNALRMRPDRIIVGECRSGEAFDMLQAMNTGHEGSMSTVHANTEADAVSRLAAMVLMSGIDFPERSIISQIASAVHVIVQLTRYGDGTRKISSISCLNKTDDVKIFEINPVFKFNPKGIENGVQKGEFSASGFVPDFIKNASDSGINVDMGIFK
ncbi:MAG: CpaF family protein [Endomicrobium sp.]|jgi:pilus assembly protein CpaF|nr:CpaF family protein [Endomicrobium sp.]